MNKLKHIGLIPDGNRRWALKNRMEYYPAYLKSAKVLTSSINYFLKYGGSDLNMITIYLMSKRNLQRQREDISAVIKAFTYWADNDLYSLIKNKRIKPNIIRTKAITENIPIGIKPVFENLYSSLKKLEDIKISNPKYTLNLLAGYDPWEEISDICNKENNVKQISIKDMKINQRVDFIIRTSGEQRISDFLPLQSGYAELKFINKWFQDLSKKDIEIAINDFRGRNRSFGN